MNKIKYIILTFSILIIFSCSNVIENQSPTTNTIWLTNNLVEKNTLLVIDEANQILQAVDLSNFKISSIGYVGNAANDIEIDGYFAYIVSSLSASVFRIDLKNNTTKTIIYSTYPANPNPYQMYIDNDKIYVTLSAGNKLSVIDKYNFYIITNISLNYQNGYPEGVIADNNYIYITIFDNDFMFKTNKILIYVKSNYNYLTNINTIENPQYLTKDQNGNIYIACTGKLNNSWIYEGGGIYKINQNNFSVEPFYTNLQCHMVKYNNNKIYALDSKYGIGKSGLNIFNLDGTKVTNLLPNKDLKGVDFDNNNIYISEGYYGNYLYIINKENYEVKIISNVGGGDCVLY